MSINDTLTSFFNDIRSTHTKDAIDWLIAVDLLDTPGVDYQLNSGPYLNGHNGGVAFNPLIVFGCEHEWMSGISHFL